MIKIKRLVTMLLAMICLSMTILPAYAADNTIFSDVAANAWYADSVAYVQEQQLMSGTSDTTFGPNTDMSRSMLATVLYRIAGTPVGSVTTGFSDVIDGAWYADAVNWATENKIVSGYGNSLFGTFDPVTREQIAAILWRHTGSPSAEAGATFSDVSAISDWAVDAVNWAYAVGIVGGKENNRFDPKASATRAEVATMLRNYLSQNEVPQTPEVPDVTNEEKRTLVVYFSQPETSDPNNMTEEEANSTVIIDGEVLGNTQYMAYVIQRNTDADIFRIEPEIPYPLNHETLVDQAMDEQNRNFRPVIKNQIENMDEYDTIFLGYPIWWSDMPMILYSFLETYDLSGKAIVPFSTHGGSGFSSTISAVAELQPDATLWRDGLTISRNNIQNGEQEIINWVNQIDVLD